MNALPLQALSHGQNDPLLHPTRPLELGLYQNSYDEYFHPIRLYLQVYNRIPHKVSLRGIDSRKANEWLLQHHEQDIRDLHYSMQWKEGGEGPFRELIYLMGIDLMLHFDMQMEEITVLFRETEPEHVHALLGEFSRFKPKMSRAPKLFLIGHSPHGLTVRPMAIDHRKLSVEEHYNDDFQAIHQTILTRLRRKNDNGLVLLHGEPGTGKTSYIRHLIAQVRKPVIFMPPNMARHVASPDLIDLLLEHPNSVLVIEDAEQIVTSRDIDGNSPVSGLLNLCDGLLSDCLRIQVICSFNTGLSRIDPALLRAGRLIARYEFGKLSPVKSEALFRKLGLSETIQGPMTLASIYHGVGAPGLAPPRPKARIGFRNDDFPF